MGQLVFQANSGGQTNLVGQNTASTFNLNIPLANGTLVSTGDTATVTSAMISGPVTTAKGGTGLTSFTSGGAVYATSTSALTTGTLPTSAGGTNLTSFTANGVLYASSSSALTTGSALTFDGSKLVAAGSNEAIRVASDAPYINFYNAAQTTQYGYIQHTGTDFAVVNVQNGAIPFYTNNTEQMRLNSTGLGIGTTAPGYPLSLRRGAGVACYAEMAGNNQVATSLLVGQDAAGLSRIFQNGAYPITFWTNYSEQMRLDSSGNLLVGTTSNLGSYKTCILSANNAFATSVASTAASTQVAFFNPNGAVGSITTSGTLTSYNVTSDQRLKENIVDADSASVLIDSLQVRKFDWKSDNTHQRYGFVAQELVTVAPEAVHQPADPEEMMAVDYSKLVPMLVKEIQSLRKRLAALEAK